MSTDINSLNSLWTNVYSNDKKLEAKDIKALKEQVSADKNITKEEVDFLREKLSELGNEADKSQLQGLLADLNKFRDSGIKPASLNFPDGGVEDPQIQKITAAQENVSKNSQQVDDLLHEASKLLQTGKKPDFDKAMKMLKTASGLSEKVIDDLNFLKANIKGEGSQDIQKGLKAATIAAKLNLATIEVLGGQMGDASKVLFKGIKSDNNALKHSVSKSEIDFMKANINEPSVKALLTQYKNLTKPVNEYFKAAEEQKRLEGEFKNIQTGVSQIQTLLQAGKGPEAAAKTSEVIAKMEKNFPDNKEAISGLKLQLATALLQSNKSGEAGKILDQLATGTDSKEIKDRALFLKSQVLLKDGKLNDAMKLLETVSKSPDKDIAKSAREIKGSIESGFLDGVEKMVDYNSQVLRATWEDKTPQSGWALLNPLTSTKMIAGHYDNLLTIHTANLNDLQDIRHGINMAQIMMKKHSLTLKDVEAMSPSQMAKTFKISIPDAMAIDRAMNNPDVKQIMSGNVQGKFSWDKNTLYKNTEYLDTEFDVAAKWIGNQVRETREFDEVLMRSNSKFDRAVGYTSAFILDSLSDANHFVKDTIKNANEFYNEPSTTWYGSMGNWVGGKLTFGGEILATTFTAPATLADHRASDAERSEALKTTALIVGTMGLIKAGGPAWNSLGNGAKTLTAGVAARTPQLTEAVVAATPNVIKAPLGRITSAPSVQTFTQGVKNVAGKTSDLSKQVGEALVKERHLVKPREVAAMPTVEVTTAASSASGGISKSQQFVNDVRTRLQSVPGVNKIVKSPEEIQAAMSAVSKKIDDGFFGLMGRNSQKLEAKGFSVPKNMDEFNSMVIKDPAKAKEMVTASIMEEEAVKTGLNRIMSKKGVSPEKLSDVEKFKTVQDYLKKNPEAFYDEFGGLMTEHFAKGMTNVELRQAGLEYFAHYTGKDSVSKMLSSGKLLEQKWDMMTGPLANLTDDLAAGKLLNPLELGQRLKSVWTETRTWGFRSSQPLGLDDINTFDKTVASLNTSKSPEAVMNVLLPKSRMGSPKDWKRINDFIPGTQSLGTVRGGVELFPKQLSESIISQAEKKMLIKGITYQGTVPPEIVNAIAGGVFAGNAALVDYFVDWDDFMQLVDHSLEQAIPKKE